VQRLVALVAAIAAEHARNAVLEHVPVVRLWPEQSAPPIERAQRIDDVVVVDGRRVRWPQQGRRRLGRASSPRPAREDGALLAQREIRIADDVARMREGACRIQQCVEIEWTVVAPVTRHGSPLAFGYVAFGVRAFGVRAFGCAAVSNFFKCIEWRDDLVGVAETFKCLFKELFGRA